MTGFFACLSKHIFKHLSVITACCAFLAPSSGDASVTSFFCELGMRLVNPFPVSSYETTPPAESTSFIDPEFKKGLIAIAAQDLRSPFSKLSAYSLELGKVVNYLIAVPVGPDLMIKRADLDLLQSLRRTRFGNAHDIEDLVIEINQSLPSPKLELPVAPINIQAFIALQRLLDFASKKIDAIAASHLELKFPSNELLIYNIYGKHGQKIYDAAFVAANKKYYDGTDYALTREDINAITIYLNSVIENRMDALDLIELCLSALYINDQQHGTDYVRRWSMPLLKRLIVLGHANYLWGVKSGWPQIVEMKRSQIRQPTKDIMLWTFDSDAEIADIASVFVAACKAGHTDAFDGLRSIWIYHDKTASMALQALFKRVESSQNAKDKTDVAGYLFLAFITHQLYLVKNQGSIANAADMVDGIARGIELFRTSGLVGWPFDHINYEVLAAKVRALKNIRRQGNETGAEAIDAILEHLRSQLSVRLDNDEGLVAFLNPGER